MIRRMQQPVHSDDPRYQRSLHALTQAIIGLVETTPIREITVTRIVAAAGLTRPTFYQHFTDVPSALQLAALHHLEAGVPHISGDVPHPFADLPIEERMIMTGEQVLDHLGENRHFYLSVLEAAPSTLFIDILADRVYARMLPEVFQSGKESGSRLLEDLKYVLASGSVWLVLRWFRGELPGTPRDVAARLARMLLAVARQDLTFSET